MNNSLLVITGQQKIMLDKWEAGILKDVDLYGFLRSRYNKIPHSIKLSGTDADAIIFCIKNSIVKTNPHKSINFYSKLPHSRAENRRRLKKDGII